MPDARAGAHVLQFAGSQDLAVAQAVLMGQSAGEDVGHNLHVPVTVHAKAFAWVDAVFVHHAQRAEVDMGGIVVLAEREGVIRVEPAMLEVAPLGGFSRADHCVRLLGHSRGEAVAAGIRLAFRGKYFTCQLCLRSAALALAAER